MKLTHHPDRTVVQFSATELQEVGLPPRPAFVDYDQRLLLSGYSAWLDKQSRFEDGIDKLIALADQLVYH